MELGAFGGFAMLAALIHLAVQVRQGRKAGNRESYRAWVSDVNKLLFEPQQMPGMSTWLERFGRASSSDKETE